MVQPTCPHCGEKFTRQEHVDRHIRSHTNEKPFQCKICQKCFSRRDLLTRHEKGHAGPGVPTIKATSVRAPTACLNCAASKQKCSGEQNCERCQKKGVECVFPESGAKRKAYRSQTMEGLTSRFESVEMDHEMVNSSINTDRPQIYYENPNGPIHMPQPSMDPSFSQPMQGPGQLAPQPPDLMAPMYYNMYGIDSSGPLSMVDPTYTMGNFCQGMVAGDLNDLLLNVFDDNSSLDESGTSGYSDLGASSDNSPHVGERRHLQRQQDPDTSSHSRHGSPYYNSVPNSHQILVPPAVQDFHGTLYTAPPIPSSAPLQLMPIRTIQKTAVGRTSSPTPPPTRQTDEAHDILMKHSAAFNSSSMVWKAPDRNNNNILEELTTETSVKSIPNRPKIVVDEAIESIPRITYITREKIVNIWQSTLTRGPWKDIDLVFPTLDFFQDMLDSFFMHFHPQYPLFHLPSFDPNTALPHLVGAMIGIGTIWSCGLPKGTEEERNVRAAAAGTIKGIGFGLIECSRRAMQNLVESDNRSIRQIDAQQSSFLTYLGGTWSGVKRQMELGQAFCQVLFTMCRGSDRFQNRDFAPLQAILHDPGFASTEARWDHWIRAERRKRFVYCLMLWDAQIGAQFQLSPFLQPAEMALPIPSSDALWYAKTAEQWYNKALEEIASKRAGSEPSFANISGRLLFHDSTEVLLSHHVSSSALLKITLIASLRSSVYEYRKMQNSFNAAHPSLEQSVSRRKRKRQSEANPISAHKMSSLVSQYTYLCDLLLVCEDVCQVKEGQGDIEADIFALIMIHNHALELNCSFNNILTMAGRVNAAEAKRVLPILLRWVDEEEARRAVWHAGQILALCRQSTKHNRVMHALPLTLFHACLALWAYGLLDAVSMAGAHQSLNDQNSGKHLVFLDQSLGHTCNAFIKTKQGLPVISSALITKSGQNDEEERFQNQQQSSSYVTLDKQKEIMDVCIDLILSIDGGGSLASDLANLLKSLGASGTYLIHSYRKMKQGQ